MNETEQFVPQLITKAMFCKRTYGFGLFYNVWKPQMEIILMVSSLVDLLVAYTIFMNKRLTAHPAYLVGTIALVTGFYS